MTANARAAAEALRQFRVIFGAVRQHFQAVEKACGISGAQIRAMAALRQTPVMRVSELAQALSIHASTASNLLDKIEEAGLIRRERNRVDQRVVRLYLTAAGEKALDKAPSRSPAFSPTPSANCPRVRSPVSTRTWRPLIAYMGEVDRGDAQKPLAGL